MTQTSNSGLTFEVNILNVNLKVSIARWQKFLYVMGWDMSLSSQIGLCPQIFYCLRAHWAGIGLQSIIMEYSLAVPGY